jgi:hypothetical protein
VFRSPTCVLYQLFEVDPAKRLGAGGVHEIKHHPYFANIDWKKLANLELTPPFVPEVCIVSPTYISFAGSVLGMVFALCW